MFVQRMPSPDLLYTQNEYVGVETLENTVSMLIVSAENVRMFDDEVENDSSSEQAPNESTEATTHNIANTFFIIKHNAFSPIILRTRESFTYASKYYKGTAESNRVKLSTGLKNKPPIFCMDEGKVVN